MNTTMTEERVAVSQKQESTGDKEEVIYTVFDVDRAWKEQVDAVSRWEFLVMRAASEELCERAWDDMQEATRHAVAVEEAYHDQYQRREWLANGRWTVQPIMGVGA